MRRKNGNSLESYYGALMESPEWKAGELDRVEECSEKRD